MKFEILVGGREWGWKRENPLFHPNTLMNRGKMLKAYLIMLNRGAMTMGRRGMRRFQCLL